MDASREGATDTNRAALDVVVTCRTVDIDASRPPGCLRVDLTVLDARDARRGYVVDAVGRELVRDTAKHAAHFIGGARVDAGQCDRVGIDDHLFDAAPEHE